MIITENNVELTQVHEDFLKFVLSADFPWFYQESNANNMMVCHPLMIRDEDKQPVTGKINSTLFSFAEEIFKSFCKKQNIKVNTIFRAAFNCTWRTSESHTGIHTDHNFPHYNFILYLNDASGDTVIFDKDNQEVLRIKPEKHKAVVFSGEPHAQECCAIDERRVVMVVTFN